MLWKEQKVIVNNQGKALPSTHFPPISQNKTKQNITKKTNKKTNKKNNLNN